MKKIIIFLIIVTILSACTDVQADTEEPFEVIEKYINYSIVYYEDTKVIYYYSRMDGSLTMLVDADGKPLIYEE